MNHTETLAAAHRAANGVLRDWVRAVFDYTPHASILARLARAEPSAEVLHIALRAPGRVPYAKLDDRQRLALQTFYTVLRVGDALVPAVVAAQPTARGHLAERTVGGDDDRNPSMDDRETLR